MKRSAPMRRTPMKRKPAKRNPKAGQMPRRDSPNGFPEETRMEVRFRSGGRCEVQSAHCTGPLEHFHHRQLRRHRNQTPANCLGACSACHSHIHANPTKSYIMGWLVHEWSDPAEVPVKRGALA